MLSRFVSELRIGFEPISSYLLLRKENERPKFFILWKEAGFHEFEDSLHNFTVY